MVLHSKIFFRSNTHHRFNTTNRVIMSNFFSMGNKSIPLIFKIIIEKMEIWSIKNFKEIKILLTESLYIKTNILQINMFIICANVSSA